MSRFSRATVSTRPRSVGWALGLGLLLTWACRDEVPEEVAVDTGGTGAIDYGECEPGEELPCTCANGAAGNQLCLESGYERGPCLCDVPMPPPGTTTDGGSTGSSGGTTGTGGSGGSSGTGLDSSGGG